MLSPSYNQLAPLLTVQPRRHHWLPCFNHHPMKLYVPVIIPLVRRCPPLNHYHGKVVVHATRPCMKLHRSCSLLQTKCSPTPPKWPWNAPLIQIMKTVIMNKKLCNTWFEKKMGLQLYSNCCKTMINAMQIKVVEMKYILLWYIIEKKKSEKIVEKIERMKDRKNKRK